METVLKRKDQTSILCSPALHYQHSVHIKVKIAKIMIASSLVIVGIWIMFVTF